MMKECVCVFTDYNYKWQDIVFFNYNMEVHNFLQKFARHVKTWGGTLL